MLAGIKERLLNLKPGQILYLNRKEYHEFMREAQDTTELLNTREKTHGSFESNADMWQSLCEMFKQTAFHNDAQRLAANMIFLKLARMSQNPGVQDHWDDIAGYAKLGSQACK